MGSPTKLELHSSSSGLIPTPNAASFKSNTRVSPSFIPLNCLLFVPTFSLLYVRDHPQPTLLKPPTKIKYMNSSLRSKGRWTRSIFRADKIDEPLEDTMPIYLPYRSSPSLNDPPATIKCSASRPTRDLLWHNIFESPSHTENATDSIEPTTHRPVFPPTFTQRPTPVPRRNIPPPIEISEQINQHQILAYNPDHTQFFDPGNIPFDSPLPLTPSTGGCIPGGHIVQEPANIGDIINGITSLNFLAACLDPPSRQQTSSTVDSWTTVPQSVERKMLIIGSTYETPARQRSTHVNVTSTLYGSLYGVRNDVRELRAAFQTRGYSVETMTTSDFDRDEVLTEVAQFLDLALPGDVRAIVFTGHSNRTPNSDVPELVMPRDTDSTISALDWNQTIRAHTKPGVVVLSIMATCFSGGFAEQGVRITDLNCPQGIQDPACSDSPIHITFSSSRPMEQTYESSISPEQSQFYDHFLWALARTATDTRVRTWSSFVDRLTDNFYYARIKGAAMEADDYTWLCDHPQHPVLTVANPSRLPTYLYILPVNLKEA